MITYHKLYYKIINCYCICMDWDTTYIKIEKNCLPLIVHSNLLSKESNSFGMLVLSLSKHIGGNHGQTLANRTKPGPSLQVEVAVFLLSTHVSLEQNSQA